MCNIPEHIQNGCTGNSPATITFVSGPASAKYARIITADMLETDQGRIDENNKREFARRLAQYLEQK